MSEEDLGQWGPEWGANPGPGGSCPHGAQMWVTRQDVSSGRPSVTGEAFCDGLTGDRMV